MKQALYSQIVQHLTLDRDSVTVALQHFPQYGCKEERADASLVAECRVHPDTMLAIYLRRAQNEYRQAHAQLSAQEHPADYFYLQFRKVVEQAVAAGRPQGSAVALIKEMGEMVGLPPCLMARFIIKSFLAYRSDYAPNSSIANPNTTTNADTSLTLLEPTPLDSGSSEPSVQSETAAGNNNSNSNSSSGTASKKITQILKNPELVLPFDPELAACLGYCLEVDVLTSPAMDHYRSQAGLEKEAILEQSLQVRQVLFQSESSMRALGYPKTPDALLAYPVEVGGHIVNWIESKALFGDAAAHATYSRDQYWPYYNRFGPGLVIYWFGFVEELNVDRERGILIMDRFPDTINKIQLAL